MDLVFEKKKSVPPSPAFFDKKNSFPSHQPTRLVSRPAASMDHQCRREQKDPRQDIPRFPGPAEKTEVSCVG